MDIEYFIVYLCILNQSSAWRDMESDFQVKKMWRVYWNGFNEYMWISRR